MGSPTETIWDCNEEPLHVGSRVVYGNLAYPEDVAAQTGEVTAISDVDVDHDDETGRAKQISPRVTVRFQDGTAEECTTVDVTPVSWRDYPDGPDELIFQADDLEVVP